MYPVLFLASVSSTWAQDAVSEYASRRLSCWSETRYSSTTELQDDGRLVTHGGDYTVWGVRDGRGQAVDTVTFAGLVGDEGLLAELQDEVAVRKQRGRTITLGGVILSGVGGAAMLLGPRVESTGITVAGSLALPAGISVGVAGWSIGRAATAPLEQVSLAYDQGLASQRCASYNDALREELGLTREQTRLIDTVWVQPPPRPRVRLGIAGAGVVVAARF